LGIHNVLLLDAIGNVDGAGLARKGLVRSFVEYANGSDAREGDGDGAAPNARKMDVPLQLAVLLVLVVSAVIARKRRRR
jgi:hypothetical protein